MKRILLWIFILFSCQTISTAQDSVMASLEENYSCDKADIFVPQLLRIDPSIDESSLSLHVANIREFKIMVFSRKGTRVFTMETDILYHPQKDIVGDKKVKEIDTGWRGEMQGRRLAEGAYSYLIEATCLDKQHKRYQGIITIEYNDENP